ncbi:cytochrome c oxidase subunit 6C-like protein [Dinothrombium tinctorium]|uniref:Cytochrome c oxidase subunit 6C-like protein n=1 Tax=Dinothrombium tinctorium TaxID=1965070 RepID=A0A443QGE5_9ACAR|nr:cytochrome c oxidase subunit 6C-like protein [Dinothrombium tinctorium]
MEVKRLEKPRLRYDVARRQSRTLLFAGALAFTCALAYRHLVAERRKRRYAEFYKTYDAEREMKRMLASGIGLPRRFQDQED